MAAEGVFPKSDGDISYASEHNRYARAGGFIGRIPINTVGSSTNGLPIGSIVIGAGSLAPFSIFRTMVSAVTAGGGGTFKLTLSGTGFGANIVTDSYGLIDASNGMILDAKGIISPSGGRISVTCETPTANPRVVTSNTPCYPNSGVVVILNYINSDAGTPRGIESSITTFERGSI